MVASREEQGMNFLHLSEEVRRAKEENRPVGALESTIVAHGMPYPDNLRTAREVEAIIRDHRAVPATVAILDGKHRVRAADGALRLLAKTSCGSWRSMTEWRG